MGVCQVSSSPSPFVVSACSRVDPWTSARGHRPARASPSHRKAPLGAPMLDRWRHRRATNYPAVLNPLGPAHYNMALSTAYGWTQGDVVDSTGPTVNAAGSGPRCPGPGLHHRAPAGDPPHRSSQSGTRSPRRQRQLHDSGRTTATIRSSRRCKRACRPSPTGSLSSVARGQSRGWMASPTRSVMLGTNDYVQAAVVSGGRCAGPADPVEVHRRPGHQGPFACTLFPRGTSTGRLDHHRRGQSPATPAAEALRVAPQRLDRAGSPVPSPPPRSPRPGRHLRSRRSPGPADHPLQGYFDTADTLETARNSGLSG